jgi:Flp pilus assembly protein TadG
MLTRKRRLATIVTARLHRDESGQMAIVMVLTMLIVFMLFALSFDVGLWYFDHRQAQNQADAAALAGALKLPNTGDAKTSVTDSLRDNRASVGDLYSVTFPTNAIRVCVRRDAPGVFAALSNINAVKVSACATAARITSTVPYALMAMNPTACAALTFGGNGTINIQGATGSAASTYTKSSCSPNAIQQNGNGANAATLNALANDVVGTASCSRCHPPASSGAPVLDDPFAAVPVPPISGCHAISTITTSQALPPGCYSSPVSISGNGTVVTVSTGVYILQRGLTITGSAKLTADLNHNGQLDPSEPQTLFYVTCPSSPCAGAVPSPFSVTGQGSIGLKGLSSPYSNLAIFVDRTARSSGTAIVNLAGQGANMMSGAIYAISSNVSISGNGGQETLQVAVVADTVTIQGNGTLIMKYDLSLIPPIFQALALTE